MTVNISLPCLTVGVVLSSLTIGCELQTLTVNINDNKELLVLDSVTYPNSEGYQTDITLMWHGLGNYQWSPQVWTVLDKTFIVVTDRSNPPKYYLYIYNHFSKRVSNAINIQTAIGGVDDPHIICSLIGTADNKLIISQTSPHGSGDWLFSKSGANYDVNNWAAWTNSGVNQNTYHQTKVMSNGDIYIVQRLASFASNFSYMELYKSTDNGVSFSKVTRIFDWGTTGDTGRNVPYPHMIFSNDDVLRCYFNLNHSIFSGSNTNIGMPRTFYIESDDFGVTWRNVNGSFTKDVVASGPLSLAEMDANCIAWDGGSNNVWLRFGGGARIDGVTYLLGGSGVDGNSPEALYYFNGSTWLQKVITVSGHTIADGYSSTPEFNNREIIFKYGSAIDIITLEIVGGKTQLSRFRTFDKGDNWSFIQTYTNGIDDHAQQHINFNNDSSLYKLITCLKTDGVNSNLFVKEID